MYTPPYVNGPITIESECACRAGSDGHLQAAIESWHHVGFGLGIGQVPEKPEVKQYIIVDGVVYISAALIKENTL